MKNKLYYTLFLFYLMTVIFIFYINGVFTGDLSSITNLLINGGFLVIIGILFIISTISFGRLNRCTDDLNAVTLKLQQEFKESGGKNLWENYQDKKDVFTDEHLRSAFQKYRVRLKAGRTKRGYVNAGDIEEYINDDLLDRIGMNFFNSGMPGTLTGLGILGTFLGLSLGLASFTGNDIYTISDNVGPLLTGMKVAFHTSVYGIFFSLVFSFAYRSLMADAYEKLENFLNTFRLCALPPAVSEDENGAAMLVYQANMSNAMKQLVELARGTSKQQQEGLERLVEQFLEQLDNRMGNGMRQMGEALQTAGRAQNGYTIQAKTMNDATAALLESNRALQEALTRQQAEQAAFLSEQRKVQQQLAKELQEQKEELAAACKDISEDVSSQLYAFDQMRSLYEK